MEKMIKWLNTTANLSFNKADDLANQDYFMSNEPLGCKLVSKNIWYCINFMFKLFSLVMIFTVVDYSMTVASFVFWKNIFFQMLGCYLLIVTLFIGMAIYCHFLPKIDKNITVDKT